LKYVQDQPVYGSKSSKASIQKITNKKYYFMDRKKELGIKDNGLKRQTSRISERINELRKKNSVSSGQLGQFLETRSQVVRLGQMRESLAYIQVEILKAQLQKPY
jgi:CRP-like cAMP-binding protein